MQLENSFSVSAPADVVWALLVDVPEVVPCMPGAELVETLGDDRWRTKMSVKLGPVQLVFTGDVVREAADTDTRRVVLTTRAREARGRGGAHARIESSLVPAAAGTEVTIVTDIALSGAAAQFGRGVVADVARQLTERFGACLQSRLDAEPSTGSAPPAGKPVSGLALAFRALLRSLPRRGNRDRRARSDLDS
jgi:uncharacterized protein